MSERRTATRRGVGAAGKDGLHVQGGDAHVLKQLAVVLKDLQSRALECEHDVKMRMPFAAGSHFHKQLAVVL